MFMFDIAFNKGYLVGMIISSFIWIGLMIMTNIIHLDNSNNLIVNKITAYNGKPIYYTELGCFQADGTSYKIGDTLWIKG